MLIADEEDPEWKQKRLSFMQEIVSCKLEQHDFIRDTLVLSGTKTIVAMNDSDSFWGWGSDHKGENHLGKIWMDLRAQITS